MTSAVVLGLGLRNLHMDTGLGGRNEFTAMGLMFLVSHREIRRFASSGQRSRFPVGLMLR